MPIAKHILRWVLRHLFRVEVSGLEHFNTAGPRRMVVANHSSFMDAALLAAFLPGRFTFAVDSQVASRWWMQPLKLLVRLYPMDPTDPLALKGFIKQIKSGRPAVIFPEGRITVTGSLMKVYDGAGLAADKADADVIPVRIEGAQLSHFSRLKGRVRRRWFPRISLTVLPPRKLQPGPEVTGRARRQVAGEMLTRLMTEMMFNARAHQRSLFQALLDARRVHGGRHPVMEDVERAPLSYNGLITRAILFAGVVRRISTPGEKLGVLLPAMNNTVAVMFGMSAAGRVPAMLNFTAGGQGMLSACRTAGLQTVLTSRRFVEKAGLDKDLTLLAAQLRVLYLEDLAAGIGTARKLGAALMSRFADGWYAVSGRHQRPDDAAVVLFTSGSEGQPKGVVLSHANLLANREQLAATNDFSAQDLIFNALPLFHSFGLMGGTLLPLLSGMKVFFYPSPLHYRIVPELAYDLNATVLFGTNSFLAGYAKHAHPYDFYSLRYVFAGAEKLQDETRQLWMDKFGIRVLEGYGATETSPVVAANSPLAYRQGSVGRLLPGIEHRIEPVPGVEKGGRLFVRGPNVMRGYLLHDRPGELVPPVDGWYDTGDIVEQDAEGFLFIRGRAKRFAKIAGEMVSLSAVEELARRALPESDLAVVSLPDERKGERLVLVSTAEADRARLLAQARQERVTELWVPREWLQVEALPLLGTGKIDFSRLQKLVEAEFAAREVA